jgi:hypothetical protein
MNDEKHSFTVKDRRHFTPEGETREPTVDRETVGAQPSVDPEQQVPRDTGHLEHEDAPVTFAGFLAGLAAQGGMLLGLAAVEGEQSPPTDLRGARHVISVLEMLKEKTEGKRTTEEDRIIDGVLYELRMAFVKASEKEAV